MDNGVASDPISTSTVQDIPPPRFLSFLFFRCQDDDNNDNSLLAALGRLSRWVEHCPVDATPFFLVSLPTRIWTSSRPGLGILRIAPGHRLHLRRTNV
ncbi:hypothetical protein VTJ04DRAFT_566 [Mycothermus thermophilus]|uniref:uncharacterized protein n=1 Tax=Humicola insolens TaxID=85995 RepID=UPI0037445175